MAMLIRTAQILGGGPTSFLLNWESNIYEQMSVHRQELNDPTSRKLICNWPDFGTCQERSFQKD
jgi:hypothetical protein